MKTIRYLLLCVSTIGILAGIGLTGFGLLDIWVIGSKISSKELYDYVNLQDPNTWSLKVGIPVLVVAVVTFLVVIRSHKRANRND